MKISQGFLSNLQEKKVTRFQEECFTFHIGEYTKSYTVAVSNSTMAKVSIIGEIYNLMVGLEDKVCNKNG